MATYNAFLDIVKERPDKSLKIKKPFCPYCNSRDLEKKDHIQTLVAQEEYNHHWVHFYCNNCREIFHMEYLGKNIWYTVNGKILRGIPTCFESYIYTCLKCGKDVKRHHIDKVTGQNAYILSTNLETGEKSYRTEFGCNNCNTSVESENDYYWTRKEILRTLRNIDRNKKNPQKLKLGWKIIEKTGICIINDKAIDKLDL